MPFPTLHPVILPVPVSERPLMGREKVALLSRYARQALTLCAAWSGVTLGELCKDANGAPLPSNGFYWSLSHKERFVAAVVADRPVGIDLEKRRHFTDALYTRVAAPDEWNLAPRRDDALFLRYWTAKEAVLKEAGKGLTGLSECRIICIEDELHLVVAYADMRRCVSQCWVDQDHLAAVTRCDDEILWHGPGTPGMNSIP